MIYSLMLRNGTNVGNDEFQNIEDNANISNPKNVKITRHTEMMKYEIPRPALTWLLWKDWKVRERPNPIEIKQKIQDPSSCKP